MYYQSTLKQYSKTENEVSTNHQNGISLDFSYIKTGNNGHMITCMIGFEQNSNGWI